MFSVSENISRIIRLFFVCPATEYAEGISAEVDSIFDRNQLNLVILDNLIKQLDGGKRVSQLFTRGRFDNLSVVHLTQNLFNRNQTEISFNSGYMVTFKNHRDRT